MKKIKRGFSLAEVLISTAIISIIATMGFTIAKRGIENAYKMYYYTGYKGITDAIANANAYGFSLTNEPLAGERMINTNAISHIAEVLTNNGSPETQASAAEGGYQYYAGSFRIIAPNSVMYDIKRVRSERDLNTGYWYDEVLIVMTVPKAKTSSGATDTTCLIYRPYGKRPEQGPGKKVVNLGVIEPTGGSYECKSTINLANRMDLLPFYIDDGEAGRLYFNEGKRVYKKREFFSFEKAAEIAVNGVGSIRLAHPSQVK